ncbi:MAG: hypothetical protein IRY95_05560 [Clostridia bacterium]|nr:hypothetical protein [Clostridia bacterium]
MRIEDDPMQRESLYREHLSDADLAFLVETVGSGGMAPAQVVELLRDKPDLVDILLDDPRLFHRLTAPGEGEAALVRVSPFLLFTVFLRQAQRDLRASLYTQEWVGPRVRVPVFDVEDLRRFVADRERQDYLADLLASYTRVASGTVWFRTARGLRRRRVSELDLERLVALLEVADDDQRFLLYRRLGDLTLFLSGVFADYVGGRRRWFWRRGTAPDAWRRAGATMAAVEDAATAIELLETLGERYYALAAEHPRAGQSGLQRVLAGLSQNFRLARRVLNFVADRYILPFRAQWFPTPSGSPGSVA